MHKKQEKNTKPQTVYRNSVQEHASALEQGESLNANTPSRLLHYSESWREAYSRDGPFFGTRCICIGRRYAPCLLYLVLIGALNPSHRFCLFSLSFISRGNCVHCCAVSGYGQLFVNGHAVSTNVSLNDGNWNQLCVSWTSLDGEWTVYVNGTRRAAGHRLADGTFILTGGLLVLGTAAHRGSTGPAEYFLANNLPPNMAANDFLQ